MQIKPSEKLRIITLASALAAFSAVIYLLIPVYLNSPGNLLLGCLYILTTIWTLFLEKALSLKTASKIAFRTFSILSLIYLAYTAPDQRTYDVFEGGGHADYIEHIALNGSLPEMGTGWEYHQPPLYYLLSASIYKEFKSFTSASKWKLFQGINWFLFQLFIAIGLLIIRENCFKKHLFIISVLFALWPMNLAHAARIGNDSLTYLLVSCSFLYLLRYCKTWKQDELILASAYASIACFSKNTALPCAAAIFLLIALRSIKYLLGASAPLYLDWIPDIKKNQAWVGLLLIAFILGTTAILSLWPKITYRHNLEMNKFMFPGVYTNSGLKVPVSANNFSILNWPQGTLQPFVSPWEDSSGRTNFWLYLFKSAQFGEINPWQKNLKAAGYIVHFCCIGLLLLIMAGFRYPPQRGTNHFYPLFSLTLFSITALTMSFLVQRNACMQDFRYIFFLSIPISLLVSEGIVSLHNKYLTGLAYSTVFLLLLSGNFIILKVALAF